MIRNKLYTYRYYAFAFGMALLVSLLQVGCSGTKHLAEFMSKDNRITIAVELVSTHTFLAEYDRFAILVVNDKEVVRRKLFPDSGGYASTNLYLCSPTTYILKGYFDTWVVDTNVNTITEGKCPSSNMEYIGVFEGGGSRPWKYYSSSERQEMKLAPKGG